MDVEFWNMVATPACSESGADHDTMQLLEQATRDNTDTHTIPIYIQIDMECIHSSGTALKSASLAGQVEINKEFAYIGFQTPCAQISSRDFDTMSDVTDSLSCQSDDLQFYDEGEITEIKKRYKVTEQMAAGTGYLKNFICSLRLKHELTRHVPSLLYAIEKRKVTQRYHSVNKSYFIINKALGLYFDQNGVSKTYTRMHAFDTYKWINDRYPFRLLFADAFTDLDVFESLAMSYMHIELDKELRILYDENYHWSRWTDRDKQLAQCFPIPITQLIKQGVVCPVRMTACINIDHCPLDWFVPFRDVRFISGLVAKRYARKVETKCHRNVQTEAGLYVSVIESEITSKSPSVIKKEEEKEEEEEEKISDFPFGNRAEFISMREVYMRHYAYIQLAKRISRRTIRRARAMATVEHLVKTPDTLLNIAKHSLMFYVTNCHPPPGLCTNEEVSMRVLSSFEPEWLSYLNQFVRECS